MFLIVLGGTLTVGAGLLAAASYSEGTLVAFRTTAQVIAWLLVLATLVALRGLPRATVGEISAVAVAFLSGMAMLYLSYVEWAEIPHPAISHAAAGVLPIRQPDYKLIDEPPPVAAPASARLAVAPVAAAVAPPRAPEDPCSSLAGVESLQCRRCGDKLGVAWMVCQERARLEYCEGRAAEEATCPSAIPSASLHSPPG